MIEDLPPTLQYVDFADGDHDAPGQVQPADDAVEPEEGKKKSKDKKSAAKSNSEKLLRIVSKLGVYLFNNDSEAFASFPVGNHLETYRIPSSGARAWLQRAFFLAAKKAVGTQALQDALGVMQAMAIHDGPTEPVGVRVTGDDTEIWLDLCDKAWRAVQINAKGWAVVDCPTVRFIRARGMRPLPEPVSGGNIEELRPFLNAGGAGGADDAFILMVSWAVGALRPRGPYPLLDLNGEQGSAKSTSCRILRALIDPNQAPLRCEPREPRDLAIAANNAWILGFDNISHLSPWLSDGLCRIATGGGFATRELYSDSDERIFDAMRPLITNGIEDHISRPDLLERSVVLTLCTIPENRRRTESELWESFRIAQPRILGALLDAVVVAIRRLSSTKLATLPRMADYAQWIVAAELSLPWRRGEFLSAYMRSRETANAVALEQSTIGATVLAFMGERPRWEGSPASLLNELGDARLTDDAARRRRGWPTTPHHLSNQLKRLAPDLRRAGIAVDLWREGRNRRISLENVRDSAPPAPPAPPTHATTPETLFLGGADETGHRPPAPPAPPAPPRNPIGDSENADMRPGGAGGAESRDFSADAPSGWTRAAWAAELRRRAAILVNPLQAVEFRERADRIDAATVASNGKRRAHVCNNTGDVEWYTPREIIDAARAVMGAIDLDPASTEVANAVVGATTFYTSEDDGLSKQWAGRVWLNPPYARGLVEKFAEKLAQHVNSGEITQAITCTNNSTDTRWFQTLHGAASAMCLPTGRIRFWHPEKTSKPLQGQSILYCGMNVDAFIRAFESIGCVSITR